MEVEGRREQRVAAGQNILGTARNAEGEEINNKKKRKDVEGLLGENGAGVAAREGVAWRGVAWRGAAGTRLVEVYLMIRYPPHPTPPHPTPARGLLASPAATAEGGMQRVML